jgi:hypothetical protein
MLCFNRSVYDLVLNFSQAAFITNSMVLNGFLVTLYCSNILFLNLNGRHGLFFDAKSKDLKCYSKHQDSLTAEKSKTSESWRHKA